MIATVEAPSTTVATGFARDQTTGCPIIDHEEQTVLQALIAQNITAALDAGSINARTGTGRIFVSSPEHWVPEHHDHHYVPYPLAGGSPADTQYVSGLINAELSNHGLHIVRVEPNMGESLETQSRQFGWNVFVRQLPPQQVALPHLDGEYGAQAAQEMSAFGIQALEDGATRQPLTHGSLNFEEPRVFVLFERGSDHYRVTVKAPDGSDWLDRAAAREISERLGEANFSFSPPADSQAAVMQFKLASVLALETLLSELHGHFHKPLYVVPYALAVPSPRAGGWQP